MLIVLTGIDGAGKTTAARALVDAARQAQTGALLLGNYAGRRSMSLLSDSLGVHLPRALADVIETAIRSFNVLVSHRRARRFRGLVVMDRDLHCQLALRHMHGLARGRLLPLLIRALPQPDLVIYLDVEPRVAHKRILARGTDSERIEDLEALRQAYLALPEFPGFTCVPANGPPSELLARLQAAIKAAGGSPARKHSPAGAPLPEPAETTPRR